MQKYFTLKIKLSRHKKFMASANFMYKCVHKKNKILNEI